MKECDHGQNYANISQEKSKRKEREKKSLKVRMQNYRKKKGKEK